MVGNFLILNMGILSSWMNRDSRFTFTYFAMFDYSKDFLLLDLDNTILHSIKIDDKYQTFYRPYLDVFLEKCKKYNVIIYTNSIFSYAMECMKPLKNFQPCYLIARNTETAYAKTLDIVKKNLPIGNRKVIAIDDLEENFQDMANVIYVKPWTVDQVNDTELLYVFN